MVVNIEITEQDYAGLPPINSLNCPIHKAVSRIVPSIKFCVSRNKMLRTDYPKDTPHGQFNKDVIWSDEMREWIDNYIQQNTPINPIIFEIDIN